MKSSFVFGTLLLFGVWSCGSHAKEIPTTEEFHGMLMGCAIGANIEVSADIIGSIATIYNEDKTQGKAVIKSEAKLLDLMPEEDRLKAYELYTTCITKFLRSFEPALPIPSDETWFRVLKNIAKTAYDRHGYDMTYNKVNTGVAEFTTCEFIKNGLLKGYVVMEMGEFMKLAQHSDTELGNIIDKQLFKSKPLNKMDWNDTVLFFLNISNARLFVKNNIGTLTYDVNPEQWHITLLVENNATNQAEHKLNFDKESIQSIMHKSRSEAGAEIFFAWDLIMP